MKPIFYFLFLLSFHEAQAENPDQEPLGKVMQIRQAIAQEFLGADSDSFTEKEMNLFNYNHLDPQRWIPTDLLRKALLYYDKNKTRFSNKNYITIVDFSPRSNTHRLFLVDLKTGRVDRYRTTHGEGSDVDNDGFAESFGNRPGSKKSSLGFVRTAEVYHGSFGRSLRLDGLSSTNSRMRERAVVFHGWAPVKEANQLQPRSWGCVTSDLALRDGIIDKIKNGSLMLVDVSQP